jgi:hypothetical protein
MCGLCLEDIVPWIKSHHTFKPNTLIVYVTNSPSKQVTSSGEKKTEKLIKLRKLKKK